MDATESLLRWADKHYRDAARKTRAVQDRPEAFERYLARLDALWWSWASREWAGWSPELRAEMDAEVVSLEAEGIDPRTATRTAFARHCPGAWPGSARRLVTTPSATGADETTGHDRPEPPAAALAHPITNVGAS